MVRVRDAADVSAAIRFAAARRLRLVVKGGGHSYLGGSNAPDSLLIWGGSTQEAGTFWHGYQSVWLPSSLLQPEGRTALAQAWFDASRQWSTTLHFNKGLAGAPAEAIAASRQTAMNPQVLEAFALAIIAMDGPSAFPGMAAPQVDDARSDAASIGAAMDALRRAAPEAGSYLSECDYALPGWQKAIWGENWARLDRIKRRFDPEGLFFVHHAVGSERWSRDGFKKVI